MTRRTKIVGGIVGGLVLLVAVAVDLAIALFDWRSPGR